MRLTILFYCLSFIILGISPLSHSIDESTQFFVATTLIILLGIPHGSIDHLIMFEKDRVNKRNYYILYFGLMIGYMVAWFFFPTFCMILFLFISAYHFGQSQFSDINNHRELTLGMLYFFWGASILSALFYYQHDAIKALFDDSSQLGFLRDIFAQDILFFFLSAGLLIVALSMILLVWKGIITFDRLLIETFSIFLLHMLLYNLPLMIGFTVYFTIWHSAKVMIEEYMYFSKERGVFSIREFFKIIFPFSFLSIFVSIVALIILFNISIGISKILLLFIFFSVLTLPHSVIMSQFYSLLYKNGQIFYFLSKDPRSTN